VKSIFLVWICCAGLGVFAQTDSVYRVGLILPFETESMMGKLDEITNAHDLFSANRVHFDDDAVISVDFYQGVLQALNQLNNMKIELYAYDCQHNDSVTAEILQKPELKKMDFIIGSVSTSTAKLVAEFCKTNKILNIQPFTPSKSLTAENPYHLKLAPTIDAHIDDMYQSILDGFPEANIIIYTPKNERAFPLAQRYDSLFKAYNALAEKKYKVILINSTDQPLDDKKTGLADLLDPVKPNILIITSYDEPFVQSTLRTIYEKADKLHIIVYGLPTWLNGDILRLDYINDLNTRISDPFWADSTNPKTLGFMESYKTSYLGEPSKYAFLGFDVMNFLMRSVQSYGKDFLPQIITQRYTGAGYKFDITQVMKSPDVINYYENDHVNVLSVAGYSLHKMW
jgi:ABC-type branched-subunit amino acid transport system substrate-binding protein